ncbi:MAG: MBOAT family protein [Candidatus Taylorbacteria bacterium]|nr:MBOAT family protein [Candidatus Taylorbacteria bacterium]
MIFNSIQFVLFFIVITTAYFLIPHRFRWLLLLLASCYFYMAFIPIYILILAGTIIIDYFAGILIENSEGKRKRLFLIISIISNIGILAFFKYFNFFIDNINHFANLIHWNYSLSLLSILLPIGLSFHTFQALSYTIEVYRGKQKAERHFGIYALYVMFYPQLVAGPIERPQNLLHQFHEKQSFDVARVTEGLKRMTWGFFKKIVVADQLAMIVNIVYANPHGFNGPTLIMATVLFAIQLYCDFSGYSDIALGSAQVMGIRLMENFERPYFSKSIAEFWRRWHISLSSWLRDYVYYPIAFHSKNPTRAKLYVAIIFTFFLSGLWHGAGWNYVIMGLVFGFYISFSEITKKYRNAFIVKIKLNNYPTLLRYLRIITTFVLVCIGWIFFRVKTIGDAWYILTHWWVGLGDFLTHLYSYYTWKNLFSLSRLITKSDFIICILGVAVLFLADMAGRRLAIWKILSTKPWYVRWFWYYATTLAIVILARLGAQEFIYFQF